MVVAWIAWIRKNTLGEAPAMLVTVSDDLALGVPSALLPAVNA